MDKYNKDSIKKDSDEVLEKKIDYIKKNYPKVIFSPFKFVENKALGFIISDNKLVIGFINKDGSLGKLIEPFDISNIKNVNLANILNNIPIVEGFNEKDKENLINVFKTSDNITVSKSEHDKILSELNETISEKAKYKLLYDSQNNEMIAIKNKYENELEKIQNEFMKKFDNMIKDESLHLQQIEKGINEYKNSIEKFIQNENIKISDLESIIKKMSEEKEILQKGLKEGDLTDVKSKLSISEKENVNLKLQAEEMAKKFDIVQKELSRIENLKKEKMLIYFNIIQIN